MSSHRLIGHCFRLCGGDDGDQSGGASHEALRFDYGGLDMQLVVQRYPERVEALELTLETVDQPLGEGPAAYFVKAIQCDEQMAWSSPVYVRARH